MVGVRRRRPTLELLERPQHPDPRLLHDLVRNRTARHVREHEPQHRRANRVDQLRECLGIAASQALDESRITREWRHHRQALIDARCNTTTQEGLRRKDGDERNAR